jgi:hypothetical protein
MKMNKNLQKLHKEYTKDIKWNYYHY